MLNLNKVFNPRSIALIGASGREGSVGHDLLKNLITSGFAGKIFPVNPKYNKLLNLKCYASLADIKESVDLMIVAVPAKIVPSVLGQGGSLKIPAAIVISAGFKEVGNLTLEEEITKIAKLYKINLLGPNCLGVLNPVIKLNASFSATDAQAGQIAFISQSGALCTAFIDAAKSLNLGFSKFISVGNKAVIDEADLLNYLVTDKFTKIIALYVEQLARPKKFLEACQRLAKAGKPVVILKGGRTQIGAGASASHTGALAGNDEIYQALFRQGQIIRAKNINELLDYLQVLNNNLDLSVNKLAIVTNAGGPGVLAADMASVNHLNLASFSLNTSSLLANSLPANASLGNPIDILGDAPAERYRLTLNILAKDKHTDSVLVILSPQSMSDIKLSAQAILSFKKETKKTVVAVLMGEELVAKFRDYLRQQGIAVFDFPEPAVKALTALHQWSNHQSFPSLQIPNFSDVRNTPVNSIIKQVIGRGDSHLLETEALKVLAAYNLPVLRYRFVNNLSAAKLAASNFKDKVALKIVSPDILHKTEVGGVILSVAKKDIPLAYKKLIKQVKKNKPEADISGVLISEMITGQLTELIIGAVRDPALGPAVMIGLGGIYVEILADRVFGVDPLSRAAASKMLTHLKSSKILQAYRGRPLADQEKIVDCLLRVLLIMREHPEIKEIDINPLMVFAQDQGVKIADARIILR